MRISFCKNTTIRILTVMMVLCLCATVFAGCSTKEATGGNYRTVNGKLLESGELASNSNYELLWDKDAAAVLFNSRDGKENWSDILYEAYLEGGTSANGNSPIYITVANNRTLEWNTLRSYSEIPFNGSAICKKIENGIRVTYFFDTYEIAIPIDYTLQENSLKISVNTAQILEGGTSYKLVSISLAPYLCSVKNSAKDGYLFIPTGSGAIMKTAQTAEGTRTYSGEVYGADASRQVPKNYIDNEEINLPIFAAVGDGKALMGIIEEGIGAAKIEAQAGNEKLGYSNVWTTFFVRGYDEYYYKSHGTGSGITKRVSDKISTQVLSVSYYSLGKNDANLSTIARKYREYLQEKGVFDETQKEYSPYSVTFLGGTNITKSILGIPKIETKSLTTFSQVEDILNQLKQTNQIVPTVRLLGFGDNGINPGTIIGGEKLSSIYGGKKDLTSLQNYCAAQNTSMFYDYEVVKFSKTGSGFSTSANSAQTAIKKRITRYFFSPLRLANENTAYSILSREKLMEVSDKAVKTAQKYENKAISFSSLGGTAFSDFSDEKYYNKRGIEEQVLGILRNVKKNGLEIGVASANYYAAAGADVIFETATGNGDYISFDECVPFYQMVFHSYKPMYSEALNYSENYKKDFARAVAYGTGLGFTLTSDYIKESNDLDVHKLYATLYSDNAALINELLVESGYIHVYETTKDAELVDYEMNENGVSKTEYSNSAVVYVNHTNKKVKCSAGTLLPYGFLMK